MHVSVDSFFDKATSTVSHVVVEPNGRHCAIVDPVLDYVAASASPPCHPPGVPGFVSEPSTPRGEVHPATRRPAAPT